METALVELFETWFSHLEASLDQLDVSVLESILYDCFIFFNRDGTSGVNNVSTGFRVSIDAIYGCFDQLFLEM